MPIRLALVECRNNHEGPWTIAKGNEAKIEIFGLGHGEQVRLDVETSQGSQTFDFSQHGVYSWPSPEASRYRFVKLDADEVFPQPTTVRVLLNGKH